MDDEIELPSLDEEIARFEGEMMLERRDGPHLVPVVARLKKHLRADPALAPEDADTVIAELMVIVRRVIRAEWLASELAAARTGKHWEDKYCW